MDNTIQHYIDTEITPYINSSEFKNVVSKATGQDVSGILSTMRNLSLLYENLCCNSSSSIIFSSEEYDGFNSSINHFNTIVRKFFPSSLILPNDFHSEMNLKALRLVDIIKIREFVVEFDKQFSYALIKNDQGYETPNTLAPILEKFLTYGSVFNIPQPISSISNLTKIKTECPKNYLYECPSSIVIDSDHKQLFSMLDLIKSGSTTDIKTVIQFITDTKPDALDRMRQSPEFIKRIRTP